MRPWKVLNSFANNYRTVTKEVCRVDYLTLQHIHPVKLSEFDVWEKTLRVHNTFHVAEERLKPYIGQRSRCGKYEELTLSEYTQIIQTKLEDQVSNRSANLVELGFNQSGEICKAAYVYKLQSMRFLFFCLGMDHGLKTLYVTPHFKHRNHYQGMKYLTLEEAQQLQ